MKTFKYSETFFSAQGEGQFTGRPSLWIRFYLCNLQCDGFGEDDPTNPDSWELPYNDLDLKDITTVEELPVFSKGCDSSYTWSKKYRHLMKDKTASDIVDELEALLPHGLFVNPDTKQDVHMVFTGGEPMMKHNQEAMCAILEEFSKRKNLPSNVTVETNGTQDIEVSGKQAVSYVQRNLSNGHWGEWFWSVSPKLWSTAGEKVSRAIKPGVVAGYAVESKLGQLKYVVNGSSASWNEVKEHTALYRLNGVGWDVWIMGVGGTVEGLKLTEADIADESIQLGYSYTTRAHCHIYGNAIGK
jgi:organic radical activating enzyme